MADRLPCLAGTDFIIMSNYIECQCSKLVIKHKLFFVLKLKMAGVRLGIGCGIAHHKHGGGFIIIGQGELLAYHLRAEMHCPCLVPTPVLAASSIMCVVTIAASIS